MRILILGGGAVGALVARRLIGEKNEVVIVEKDEERCLHLEETLDAKIIPGNASSIHTLQRAGLGEAEMLIAVTNSDEANLLGCLIAEAYSDVKIKVARLRTHEVDDWRSVCGTKFLNIDLVIHPDRETAERILRVVAVPGISEILEFAEGKVKLIGMNITNDSWVVGKSMAELDKSGPPKNSLIAMIFRGHRVIIPRGDDRLYAGDHAYIVVSADETQELFNFMGIQEVERVKRVFIVGGKQIGIEVALQLEKQGVQVKLFERDLHRCEKISTLVKSTVVVHADGTDQRTLVEENIEGIDAYLALTGDDEDNIIASLLSKRFGARKAGALVNRLDFLPMAQLLGINSIFSSRLVVVDRILQFARKGHVLSVTTFRQEEAEAIELVATPGSKFLGTRLKNVHLPHGAIVGAIVRPSGEVIIPRGDAIIEAGDRVIFFCLETLVPQLESAFFAGVRRVKA
ncbi:Trk system potassium transporter TrkA [Acidobacteria bacterium AH-259-G07]|nr:Trk system potassium transporter TrkA [Acidobacteria bacterium AH-259-G07]